jgi:integrase
MKSVERYWQEQGKAFVDWKRQQDEVTEGWLARMLWCILRMPVLLRPLGFDPAPTPRKVGVEHIRALKEKIGWEPTTMANFFNCLRPFLKWIGNPIADHKGVWCLPTGKLSHRRWLTEEQLVALFRGAQKLTSQPVNPHARPPRVPGINYLAPALVACEGFNALRRIEVQRLRVKDLDFEGSRMMVHGKGRNGGKWRTIPMTESAKAVLQPLAQGRAPEDHVFPGMEPGRSICHSGTDQLIQRSAHLAGFPTNARGWALVSHHDLRRTFGRIAYYAGMNLVELKNFYGHTSIDMTAHYIGMDEDRMRDGLAKFDARMGDLIRSSQVHSWSASPPGSSSPQRPKGVRAKRILKETERSPASRRIRIRAAHRERREFGT